MSPASRKNQTSAAEGKLPPEALMQVAERFRVLGSPSRLRILNLLMDGPRPMAELAEASGLEQSNLSRHVAELERAGCVRRHKQGRTVQVEIADPTLHALCEMVCGALREQADQARSAFV